MAALSPHRTAPLLLHFVYCDFISFFAPQRAKSDLVVHEVKPLSQLSETMLKMHGGRASISGVTATVFGASGFVSRYLCNRLGTVSDSSQASHRVCSVSVGLPARTDTASHRLG